MFTSMLIMWLAEKIAGLLITVSIVAVVAFVIWVKDQR